MNNLGALHLCIQEIVQACKIIRHGPYDHGNASHLYQNDNGNNGKNLELGFDTSEYRPYNEDFSPILSQNARPKTGVKGTSFKLAGTFVVTLVWMAYENDGSSVDLSMVATALFNNSNIPDPFPYLAYNISMESLGILGVKPSV